MLESISKRFAKRLIDENIIIASEETDIYQYGFYQTVMLIFNVATSLLLGILFKLVLPCIWLNLAYISIRIWAGGYHASTPRKCYVYSTVMVAVLLSVLKWINISAIVNLIIFVLSFAIIWFLSPVSTDNDILDEVEIKVYKKRTKMVLIVQLFIEIMLFITKNNFLLIIPLAMFTESLMLILGKIHLRFN